MAAGEVGRECHLVRGGGEWGAVEGCGEREWVYDKMSGGIAAGEDGGSKGN